MQKLRKNQKGFTLVEILVVLAIMAILVAIAVPVMVGTLQDAKDKTAMSSARAAYIAYELKHAESDTVKLDEIAAYMDKNANDIQCSYLADANGKIQVFYYSDNTIEGKYIKILLGNKASIAKGTIPTTEVSETIDETTTVKGTPVKLS